MLHLDHILYNVPNLQKGIEDFEQLVGVRPIYGGQHPNLGTHNALVSLGENIYLELIAPDPEQGIPVDKIKFGLGKIKTPKIIKWAVRSTNITELGKEFQISNTENGTRTKDDGTKLHWKMAFITEFNDNSELIPFVIQWDSKIHPASTSPKGCELLEFSAEHPSPNIFNKLVNKLSYPFNIVESQSVKLILKLGTPKGIIEIC